MTQIEVTNILTDYRKSIYTIYSIYLANGIRLEISYDINKIELLEKFMGISQPNILEDILLNYADIIGISH